MKQDENTEVFPKHFFWGASSAAHQYEGDNNNQWAVWELAHARELAQTAHQRLSWLPKWHKIKDQAEEPENYVSGKGLDHYNRYKEDFKLLKELNLNSFRFSIEWSRIEPKEGHWDESEIKHYKEYIAELRRQKIEPFMNIWHWTHPAWFEEKGGFEKKKNLKYFERFVRKVAKDLIDDVEYVITLNEPSNYATFGYIIGDWPPQKKNIIQASIVYVNLVRAHKRAYKILKTAKPSLQVGSAAALANVQAKRPRNMLDTLSTRFMRYFWNWWFLNRIRKSQDFIGVNYYFSDYYKGFGKRKNPAVPLNDLGWYMEPEGLYPLLLRTWAHYKKPIFITENGLADADDEYRQWWLEETIIAMEKAISEGVDLRGYLHWSLLDNFEWAYGWWPHFGLVKVDRKNMKRTIRPSAKWFASWLESQKMR
jgi:beta-glucosidase